MKRTALRRAFRDERMRDLYLRMSEAGWRGSVSGDGHVLMIAPDGARISLSTTAVGGRSFLNNEAKYKRWVRLQNAITMASGLPPMQTYVPQETPTMTDQTPVETHDALLDEAEASVALDHDSEVQTITPERDPLRPEYTCADGCGRPVSKPGGYARGHNPASQSNAAKARAAQAAKRNGTPAPSVGAPDLFSIDDVISIAQFAGDDSGLVVVAKLRKGLEMMARMRGER